MSERWIVRSTCDGQGTTIFVPEKRRCESFEVELQMEKFENMFARPISRIVEVFI